MPLVKDFSDVPNPRVNKVLPSGAQRWRTGFWNNPAVDEPEHNVAFIQESSPGHSLRTHYHSADQFQIIVKGDGKLGRHPLKFGGVLFPRAFTPYGPLVHGENGMAFLTLRARRDIGSQRFPEAIESLLKVPNRQPWQFTEVPDYGIQPDAGGVAIRQSEKMRDERGLAAYACVMKPGAKALAPDNSKGDGQYIIVLKGGIVHEGKLKNDTLTIVWVGKDEPRFQLEAGPEGCEAVIVNFPVPGVGGVPAHLAPHAEAGYQSHQCKLCAYVYDEAAGAPDAGIPAGTRWAGVPEDFKCPDCDARKPDFEPLAF